MFRKLVEFFQGMLWIHISGMSPDRFLNLCANRSLCMRNLRKQEDGYECLMSLEDFRQSRELAKKSKVILKIRKKIGFPFLLFRYRKRKVYVAGLILSICLLYGLSFFLWDIQVEGNGYYTDDVIITFLNEQGISHGIQMGDIQCDSIEQALRNKYTNITWVSAQISGTRLIISLKENWGLLTIPEKEITPGDIVADQDGVITSLVTRAGVPQVSIGDTVTKGQVLISGRVPIMNDNGEIAGYHEVAADATIQARTTETYFWQRSIFEEEKIVTKARLKDMRFSLGTKSVDVGSSKTPENQQYQITEYWQPCLFDNFYLPLVFEKTTTYTYDIILRKLTEEEQQLKAEEEFNYYFENLSEKGVQIIEKDVKITNSDFFLTARGTLTLEGPFGIEAPLKELETPLPDINETKENET